jgi:hypothetical protein
VEIIDRVEDVSLSLSLSPSLSLLDRVLFWRYVSYFLSCDNTECFCVYGTTLSESTFYHTNQFHCQCRWSIFIIQNEKKTFRLMCSILCSLLPSTSIFWRSHWREFDIECEETFCGSVFKRFSHTTHYTCKYAFYVETT